MIIKIKKKDLIGSLTFIFYATAIILALSAISLPIVFPITLNTTKLGFKVELVITNRNPSINVSNVSFSVDPLAGGNSLVLISFNATDQDGASNINASTAVVNLTLAGRDGQFYTNISSSGISGEVGNCRNHTESAKVVINCTVVVPYFANASSTWVVNISIKDINGGTGINDSSRFTVNTLSSISLPYAAVNFSNVILGQQDVPSSPLTLNNTGNDDFDQINITAAALVGTTISSESIAATNFYTNISNQTAAGGLQLAATAVSLIEFDGANFGKNASLIHGHTGAFAPNADKGNRTVFFWIDVPSSGLSSQLFNATWNVTAINNP
ncbi:hypothetical protein HYW20_07795 [Candidatus Woesearchaeota archaeon]|nr:hypothetical protein [Candidatus Woesearchaeota archaeon]